MGNALILVVDDDASIVHLLKESLSEEGYRVLESYDGASAVSLASSQKPGVIVMDMNMPGMTGLEALAKLRTQDSTRKIPVILLTGESAQKVASANPHAERVTHAEKPVDLDRLSQLVKDSLTKYPS